MNHNNTARPQAVEAFGKVDVWVNNAGRGINRSILEVGDPLIDAMMRCARFMEQQRLDRTCTPLSPPTGVRRGLGRDVQRQRALGPVRDADRVPLLHGARGVCRHAHFARAIRVNSLWLRALNQCVPLGVCRHAHFAQFESIRYAFGPSEVL